MDLDTLTRFFMWCTILHAAMFVLWITAFALAPDLVYRIQSKWFPLSRDAFNVVMYSFLGLFKIFFLMFNVVPYVALLIIS